MEVSSATPDAQGVRLIPLGEVIKLTGRGRSRIYAAVAAREFPQPIKDGTSSRWLEREVLAWIAARVAERDAKAAA